MLRVFIIVYLVVQLQWRKNNNIILPLAGSHVDSWQLLQKNDVLYTVCILVRLSRIHIFLYVRMPFVSEK